MSNAPADPVKVDGGQTEAATHDAVLDVLADEVRRSALEYLAMQNRAVPVEELVGFVTATSVGNKKTFDGRQQTEIRFHHVHLPKMDDAGLLDYDPDEQMATPTEKVDVALDLCEQVAGTRTQ